MEEQLINTFGLVLVAALTVYNSYLTTHTLLVAKQTEVNTNSMKDALVIAAHASGMEAGRVKELKRVKNT